MGGSIPAFISGAHKSEEGVGSPRTGVTDCGKLPCERREEPLSRLSSSWGQFLNDLGLFMGSACYETLDSEYMVSFILLLFIYDF